MILEALYRTKSRLREWVLAQALRPSAPYWLFALSFIESSIFPIPPDVLLVPLIISDNRRPYWLATLVTVGSVLGGVLGYLIGAFFFETIGIPLIDAYDLHEQVATVGSYFDRNAFLAIFISAFTPIPYKVFTITAGVFNISLPIFIIASLIGRGARFYLEAWIMKYYGEKIGSVFFKYFNIITLAFAVLILLWVFVR